MRLGSGLFVAVEVAVAASLVFSGTGALSPTPREWLLFTVLTAASAISIAFTRRVPGGTYCSPITAFYVAGAVVLPPILIVALFIGPMIVHVVTRRPPLGARLLVGWANHAVPGLIAARAFQEISDPGGGGALATVAVTVAVIAFVATNCALVPAWLAISDQVPMRARLLNRESVEAELLSAAFGAVLAALLLSAPWGVPFALVSVLALPRAFSLPLLREDARQRERELAVAQARAGALGEKAASADLDPKTGLYNVRHFDEVVGRTMAASADAQHGLLMMDVDHLREINNVHGHLAGDAVIIGVADIIRRELRRDQHAARFGGDEFMLFAENISEERLLALADSIRETVASTLFANTETGLVVRGSVSIGSALSSNDRPTLQTLIAAADESVYRVKHSGGSQRDMVTVPGA